jgi:glycosyltransferase involved in cell wall biosynthesis
MLTGTMDRITYPPVIIKASGSLLPLKIGIIDHSYHAKTVSSSFFIDLLKDKAQLEIFHDSTWNGGKRLSPAFLGGEKLDALILWQVFYYYKPSLLNKIRCNRIFLVPMADDAHSVPDHYLKKYVNCSIISFSRYFHERFINLGMDSRYYQYAVDPQSLPPLQNDFSDLHGFFWQRTNDITWKDIRKLIVGSDFKSFHLHVALDPIWYKAVVPSEEEMKRYNITITGWFDKRENYLQALSQANVFFAPRLYEGIGMPFLEAMAMGMLVVSPDHPTMNEYINHNVNGLLYDIRVPKPLDFSRAGEIGGNARDFMNECYKNWNKLKQELAEWVCAIPK